MLVLPDRYRYLCHAYSHFLETCDHHKLHFWLVNTIQCDLYCTWLLCFSVTTSNKDVWGCSNVWSTELTVMHVDAIIFSVSRARINKQAIVYFPRLHPTVNHNSGTTKTTVRERLSEHARCPIRTWFQMTCHDYNSRTIQASSNFQFKHCSSKCLSVKTKTPDRYIMWLLNLNNSRNSFFLSS